jgi:hypothetical protein
MGCSCPPNAGRISRAADSIGNTFLATISVQNRDDLGRRNGVGLHAHVGRHHLGGA